MVWKEWKRMWLAGSRWSRMMSVFGDTDDMISDDRYSFGDRVVMVWDSGYRFVD